MSNSICMSSVSNRCITTEVESFFLDFDELPLSQPGVFLDKSDDNLFSEEWTDDTKYDPDFSPSGKDSTNSLESGSELSMSQASVQQSTCENYIDCSKLFVFLPLLLELFHVCREPGCGDSVDPANIECTRKGACVTITATCDSNHVTKVLIYENKQYC